MKNQSSSQGSLFGFRPPRWQVFPGNHQSQESGQQPSETIPVASPRFSRKATHIFSLAGLFVLFFLWAGLSQLLAQSQETFTTPGTINWSPPAGTYQVQIECWGGGAPGGSNLYGGNGGNYTRSIPLLIGAFTNASMTITVGGQSQESRVTGAPHPI
ncbi:MAG TPA: hypothetical protein PK509_15590, partial [Catalimonadaceae bacterium]|nr:hypothetical protein [Catalimonadaceae bacterium]